MNYVEPQLNYVGSPLNYFGHHMIFTCATPPTAGPPSRRHSLKLLAPRPRVERGCPAAAPRVEWGGPATAAAPRVHGGAPPSPSTALLNSIPGNSTHTGNYMRAVAPSQSPSQIAWVDPLSTPSVAWGQLRRCCCSGAARSAAARERRDLLPSLHNLGQRRGPTREHRDRGCDGPQKGTPRPQQKGTPRRDRILRLGPDRSPCCVF